MLEPNFKPCQNTKSFITSTEIPKKIIKKKTGKSKKIIYIPENSPYSEKKWIKKY